MKTYLELMENVIKYGEKRGDRTGTGTTSLFGPQWEHDFKYGFPLLTTKYVPFRWVAEELFWFLSGSTNVADLQAKSVDIWDEWADAETCAKFGRQAGDLGPIYGHLWRNFDGLYGTNMQGCDQLAELLTDLTQSPTSRRLIVSGWHPVKARQVSLPPCHTVFQLYCLVDGGLSLKLYARSIDIFLGLPFNIASYALLLEMLALVTGRKAAKLYITFGDLHLYNNHQAQAAIQRDRKPYTLPTIDLAMPEGNTPLARLLNFRWQHVTLKGYKHHPKLAAPVAV